MLELELGSNFELGLNLDIKNVNLSSSDIGLIDNVLRKNKQQNIHSSD